MLYIKTPPSIHQKSNNSTSNRIQKLPLYSKRISRRDQLLKMAQYEYARQISLYTQAQLHRVPCHTSNLFPTNITNSGIQQQGQF
ncbi:unnamed protein product [Cunninghamella blakesleeana]